MNLDKDTKTTRTIRANAPGPVRIKTKMTGLGLTVTVDPKAEYGELTISASVTEGPVADRVRNADMRVAGNTLSADMRVKGGGMTMIGNGGGVSISNLNSGSIIVGGGTVSINGRVVS